MWVTIEMPAAVSAGHRFELGRRRILVAGIVVFALSSLMPVFPRAPRR
jgi:hypothetical protein